MNGIIVIDKPKDHTSFDIVAIVRRILHEKKIGHTGTLDPMATGVLPVLVGRAAKAQSLLPDTDKSYIADFRLGITTDTLDITGQVLSEKKCSVTREEILSVLPRFRGDIMQVPPMYSAVQKDGVRLYDLARRGIEVERAARPVHISELELVSFDCDTQCGRLKTVCSKGTYIRVICDDIGKALGCGCVMTALRRTAACGFSEADALTLEKLKEYAEAGDIGRYIRTTDSIFACYPELTVSEGQRFRFTNGGALALDRLKGADLSSDGQMLRVYGPDRVFLGLGRTDTDRNELSVEKLFFINTNTD